MATPEGAIAPTPDVSSSVAASGSIPAESSSAPATTDSSFTDVQPQSVQGEQTPDIFEGIPSLDQLNEEAGKGVQYAKGLAQLRGAFETLKPQFEELTTKFAPFQSVADRFQNPEEVQALVSLQDKLFGFERDDSGQLVPATGAFVEDIVQRDPLVADFLAADLMNGETTDPQTGRRLPRIDLALEEMARDPERRATALRLLGGVEPSSIAPTWQPSEEELAAIPVDPENPTKLEQELQKVYSELPWEDRQNLKTNDPDFIRKFLQREKQTNDLMRATQQNEAQETQRREQQQQYVLQKAKEAGDQYVEQQFRTGFTEFAKSIVDRTKFIAPLDPNSDAARRMQPEQVQQFNQVAQRVNTGVGKMIAVVTAAMAVNDTRFIAEDFLKELGIDPKVIQEFDNARSEVANNSRTYGELNFQRQLPRNGSGQQPTNDSVGIYQSNATRAMTNMKGRANLIAQPLQELLSQFFEMKAGNYNQTLNGTPQVRPSVAGTAYNPTKEPLARPPGADPWLTRSEIERQFG